MTKFARTEEEVRPYAKAIFAIALREQQFEEWQNTLNILAPIVVECKKKFLLNNPRVGSKKELSFFEPIAKNFPAAMNLVQILVEGKKLEILPRIADIYQQLLFEHKKILKVKVVTTCALTSEQKILLGKKLHQRYQREVLLNYQIDEELIGGMMIYIADEIIDGSVKGMLQRLKLKLLDN